jgi:hypothetical protein
MVENWVALLAEYWVCWWVDQKVARMVGDLVDPKAGQMVVTLEHRLAGKRVA